VLVLVEDGANRYIANGFEQAVDKPRALTIRPPSRGGWKVTNQFIELEVEELRRYPKRRIVLVIDFDQRPKKWDSFMKRIPADVADRVYVIGTLDEPENLRSSLVKQGAIAPNTFEKIGDLIASDCREGTEQIWGHPHLVHNASEVQRMRADLRNILF